MEALESLGINGKLLLAQAINFLVLMYVLKRYAYKPMLAFLESRTERIDQGLRDAEAAQVKLKAMEEEEKRTLAEASKEARAIISQAEAQAKTREAARLVETEAEVARMLALAQARMNEEKTRMMSEVKKDIAQTVSLSVEKILKERIGDAEDRAMIEKITEK